MDAQRLSMTATGAGAGATRGHMPGLRTASGPASLAVGRRRFPGPALNGRPRSRRLPGRSPVGQRPPCSPRRPVAAPVLPKPAAGPYRDTGSYAGRDPCGDGQRGDGDSDRDTGSYAGRDPCGDGQRGDGDPCRDRGAYSRGRYGGGYDGGGPFRGPGGPSGPGGPVPPPRTTGAGFPGAGREHPGQGAADRGTLLGRRPGLQPGGGPRCAAAARADPRRSQRARRPHAGAGAPCGHQDGPGPAARSAQRSRPGKPLPALSARGPVRALPAPAARSGVAFPAGLRAGYFRPYARPFRSGFPRRSPFAVRRPGVRRFHPLGRLSVCGLPFTETGISAASRSVARLLGQKRARCRETCT